MVFRSYSQLFADIKNTDQIIANKLVAYNYLESASRHRVN